MSSVLLTTKPGRGNGSGSRDGVERMMESWRTRLQINEFGQVGESDWASKFGKGEGPRFVDWTKMRFLNTCLDKNIIRGQDARRLVLCLCLPLAILGPSPFWVIYCCVTYIDGGGTLEPCKFTRLHQAAAGAWIFPFTSMSRIHVTKASKGD